MRSRVLTIAFLAALVAGARPALAEDAGDGGNAEAGGAPDDGGSTEDSGTETDGSSSGTIVIACDGALCDTLQGRGEFECSVASGAPGASPGSAGGAGLAAMAIFGCLGAARRARRGASRPGEGGSRC
jgi:hypothetical protein